LFDEKEWFDEHKEINNKFVTVVMDWLRLQFIDNAYINIILFILDDNNELVEIFRKSKCKFNIYKDNPINTVELGRNKEVFEEDEYVGKKIYMEAKVYFGRDLIQVKRKKILKGKVLLKKIPTLKVNF